MGVYGDFLTHFPELKKPYEVWNKEDKSDVNRIVGIYLPNKGGGFKRRKYTSGNTALDITDSDHFFVSERYRDKVNVGTYVRRLGRDTGLMRLTNLLPFDEVAGYMLFEIERVTGTTFEDTKNLDIKGAAFR